MKWRRIEAEGRYREAIRRLTDAGMTLDLRPNELAMTATGAHGLRYILHPPKGRWLKTGANSNRYSSGGVGAMLEDYEARKAELDAIDRLPVDLTIFTDAGYCSRTGTAGWGAWMKRSGIEALVQGGEIKDLLPSSTEAEIRAGANALALAKKRGLIIPGSVVMWQSDSINALGWVLASYPRSKDRPVEGGLPTRKPRKLSAAAQESAGRKAFVEIAARLELVVYTRHVRGHQPGAHRQWVNRLCDEIAGNYLKSRRARFVAEANAIEKGGRKSA